MAYQGKTTKITFFEFNRFYFVLKRRIIWRGCASVKLRRFWSGRPRTSILVCIGPKLNGEASTALSKNFSTHFRWNWNVISSSWFQKVNHAARISS
jgi:hypothetical protein